MKGTALVLLIVCSLLASAAAQIETPAVVAEGMIAYQKAGARAALAIWLKGSPVENDSSAREEMASIFAQVEDAYGRMVGYDVVRLVEAGTSVRRAYIVIRFEKGPLYAAFECYKTPEAWILPNVMCNTKASEVWPESLVAGSR